MQYTDSTTKYLDQETETTTEPLYTSTAKLQHSSSSTVSIQMDTDMSQATQQQQEEEEEQEPPQKPLTRMERFKLFLTYLRPLATTLFFDVGIPLAIYYILKMWVSVLIALILSGVPPLLRVIYVFWRKRRLDILGCIFVLSFIISAVLSLISGDVRLTLLRDSTTTAIISLMFLLTLIPLKTKWFMVRPLVYLFAQQMMAEAPHVEWTDKDGQHHSIERMEWCWQHSRFFRIYCYTLTSLWGIVLMAEFVIKVIMITKTVLTVDQILLYGNIIVIVVVVTMTVGTTIASRFVRKSIAKFAPEWRRENDYTEEFTANKKKQQQAQQKTVYMTL